MNQALYRKWRPLSWDEFVNQQHVILTLKNAVMNEHLSHAYLFSGPRGTGKTTAARVLAKAANCEAVSPGDRPCNECSACIAVNEARFLDLIEIDAASNTSVDDVRDLRERINLAPNQGRYKVYIVDEVHMLSTAAFNALLKTLEEPPPHAIFILATTEVHKIPATVLSRCQRHEFRRIAVTEIADYLAEKTNAAGYEVEPEALELIARQATGSLRDAISLLDQLISMGGVVTLAEAQEVLGTATEQAVADLVQAIIDDEVGAGLTLINQVLDQGIDARQFASQIVVWLRALMLLRAGDEQWADYSLELASRQAEALSFERLVTAMEAFSRATHGERTTWQPGLALELGFMAAVSPDSGSESSDSSESSGSKSKPEPTLPSSRRSISDNTSTQEQLEGASRNPAEGVTVTRPGDGDLRGDVIGDDLQRVLNSWGDLLAAVYERDPRTQALLNSCKPLGVDEGALVLGFQSDILREKMEKGHNQEVIADSLERVLGQPMGVRCVLSDSWSSGGIETPPLHESGMVAAALRELGAEVIDYGPESDGANDPAQAATDQASSEEEEA